MSVRLSNASAILMLNALVDQLDGAAGTVDIRSGSAPTNVEDTATGTLLATLTLPAPAFGAASDNNPNAIVAANAITPVVGLAAGVAGYYRVKLNGGTAIWQGSAGGPGSGANMILTNANIEVGQAVSVTSWSQVMPEVGS